MKKSILSLIIIGLLLSLSFFNTQPLLAGDEENPEIEDEIEDEVVDYLDIISAWFFEKAEEPEYLFICLKVKEIDENPMQQKLTVHWEYNGIECAAGLAIGYDETDVFKHSAGWGHGFWFQEHYQAIDGSVDTEKGIITFKIPKEYIKDPQPGERLTNTYALTFQRYGYIGKLGFDRALLQIILYVLTGEDRSDFGPNEGYGKDYIIQY